MSGDQRNEGQPEQQHPRPTNPPERVAREEEVEIHSNEDVVAAVVERPQIRTRAFVEGLPGGADREA